MTFCDGKTTEFATLILFSPREPHFRRRVRGSQGVFSRRMSGKRRIFILTKRQIKTGRQQNSLRLFCFLPVNLVFVVAFAPLKVSLWRRMSAVATGIFILTGDNALPLTTFALAFSPVNPLSENDGEKTE